jgi:endonuclease IV
MIQTRENTLPDDIDLSSWTRKVPDVRQIATILKTVDIRSETVREIADTAHQHASTDGFLQNRKQP